MYGLLADASTNNMVGLVSRALVDKAMGFIVEHLAAIQSLTMGDEGWVVVMLADAILHRPREQQKGIFWTIFFYIAKGIYR